MASIRDSQEHEQDPRFRRLCDALASHRRYAKSVAAFNKLATSGARRRFGTNALRVGNRIYAMMAHGSFVVKLPKARVDELVKAGAGHRFDPGHGRLMKEWLVVSSAESRWAELAKEAHDYVATL